MSQFYEYKKSAITLMSYNLNAAVKASMVSITRAEADANK